jgi:hypothetical protein
MMMAEKDDSALHHCVIAICKCGCGNVVYANAADELDTKAQREIGKMVAEGYQIVRTTVGDARGRDWLCATRRREEELAKAAAEAAKPENIQRAKYEAAMSELRAEKPA